MLNQKSLAKVFSFLNYFDKLRVGTRGSLRANGTPLNARFVHAYSVVREPTMQGVNSIHLTVREFSK
jgi:hypothetical protein